jgi:predicted Zn-dependent protease
MSFRLFLFSFIFSLASCSIISQNFTKDYSPLRNYQSDLSVLTKLNKSYDSILKTIKIEEKSARKSFEKSISSSKARLKTLDSAGYLMRKDTITKYLQAIVNKVIQNNKLLQNQSLTVFTYRTEVPNASNRAAGVILFNLDLFTKMDSEEEVAFIICHEISHDILGHVVQGLVKQTEMEKNPKYKLELEKIKKQEFNKLKSYENLLAKYISEYTGQRRAHEIQADSLGLVLYLNSGYEPFHALKVVDKLDSVDAILFKDSIDYNKHFSFTDYPFKKSLLEAEVEESIGGNIDETFEMPDSLKTHPDCKKRHVKMQALINTYKSSTKNELVGNFSFYKEMAQFEMIEYLQQDYYFSKGLYYTIALLNKYPENQYLQTSFVNCLVEIQRAQKDHYFSSVVEYPSKVWGASYYQFLVFLHNTNSETTKNIYKRYAQLKTNKSSNKYNDYVNTLINGIEAAKEEREKLVFTYNEKHHENYYTTALENKLNVKLKIKK